MAGLTGSGTGATSRSATLLDLVGMRPGVMLGPSVGDDQTEDAPRFGLGPSVGDDEEPAVGLGPSVGDDEEPAVGLGPSVSDDEEDSLGFGLGPSVGDDSSEDALAIYRSVRAWRQAGP